ncbi:hypothetical protein [Bythopirellula polymerisocia]|uniref:Bacterial type II and III secretion system protein n=1 Tax=Bythopirellula polymerisocia TaxID=2528003 RepID=A0A5C6CDZ0_9BACT|nr:hypothetical protein [Bythopirellula polymerisocia]TWU21977.1 hypothetical protein Pla144_44440 [Bythopirellula polymerisocia]
MLIRIAFIALITLTSSQLVTAQSLDPGRPGASGWQASSAEPNATPLDSVLPTVAEVSPVTPGGSVPAGGTYGQSSHAQVSKGSGTLPNEDGQVWREYDISPYTLRVQNTAAPEQAIVDWILRETGYEAWHSKPVGLLSADQRTLRVYHTPQMQAIVADIVDRFVNSSAEHHGFGLRIVTIGSPNWRTRALPLMESIPVQSPGVQGWILAKEDAALLLSELKRRTDFHEHNAPHQMVQNGASLVISTMRPVTYTKGVVRTDQTWPGFQPEMGQFDEGFSMEFSPLMALDTRTVDAVLKLKLTQVEKMLSVQLEVPTAVAQNQRTECQVPQMTMVQIHERFRWPTDQVLLLSMGVVAKPGAAKPNFITDTIPILKSPPRADALLFVESRGPNTSMPTGTVAPPPQTASRPDAKTFHGRY